MRRGWWIGIGAAVALLVILLVVAQLALPRLGEDSIEDRLTEGGGTAEVSVSSFPAVRLLWGSGSRLEISASDLALPLERGELKRLRRFREVDIEITGSRAGEAALDQLTIERSDGGIFRIRSQGSAPAAAARELGIPGAGLGELFFGDTEFPVELDAEFEIDGDRINVLDGRTTIAGFPAGPIVERLVAAIIARL